MKTIRAILSIVALSVLVGCGTTFNVKPGADPVVVYAEASAETAFNVFDSFLKWEQENEAALSGVPQIHATAEEIRRDGLNWITELRTQTKIYKSNRTDKNRAALLGAQEIVDFALSEVRMRLAEGGSQ